MMNYYEELSPEKRLKVTRSIQLLYKQIFLLERKCDKETGRFTGNQDFCVCNKHLEFVQEYFRVMGIGVMENNQLWVIYVRGGAVVGNKLPKLAALYLPILKLICGEQMASVSSSIDVYVTLSDMHEKLGNYRLFKKQPSAASIRRAISLLKKYQIVKPLEMMDELGGHSRIIIYPCINMVLFGDDVRRLLESYGGREDKNDSDETEI